MILKEHYEDSILYYRIKDASIHVFAVRADSLSISHSSPEWAACQYTDARQVKLPEQLQVMISETGLHRDIGYALVYVV